MQLVISKKKIVFLIIIFFFIIFVLYKIKLDSNYAEIQLVENVVPDIEVQVESEKIKVYIVGKIKNPGVYELDVGSRIEDVVKLAGGMEEDANIERINLASEINDGEKITIPSIYEEENEYTYSEENINNGSSKININKASSEELQKINGVGPALAEKIISYREENGKFKSIEDLKNVSGIGIKKYETIKDSLTIK